MKYYELNKEERELLEAVENQEYRPTASQNKTRQEIVQAAKEGIPYQTLAASILHKSS